MRSNTANLNRNCTKIQQTQEKERNQESKM
uniref:Uncharacterized protein n=1 Tax=Arundo donax TaxID=35708 RepID=A0A0A9A7C9_ARUDO